MKTITKKEIASLVRISSDAFGKNFEIDTTSEYDSKYALIATRESLKSEVNINLNGIKTKAYMNGSSKNEFVNSVYDAIERINNDTEKAKLLINWAELSRTLAGDRSAITKDRIPKKHKETIENLIKSIDEWLLALRSLNGA
jgi:hypothetical protein